MSRLRGSRPLQTDAPTRGTQGRVDKEEGDNRLLTREKEDRRRSRRVHFSGQVTPARKSIANQPVSLATHKGWVLIEKLLLHLPQRQRMPRNWCG
ncbi:hypothetical protein NDU88_002012 [Pleurodeles waltl]|uniref:Uncharacterized protein n=1 Tax=Pleurodeles waltl TaxID=8319 RepID=A0AAV7U8S4_PLEWA|nr:hypothetical protein NDU88_002012 [Pleurodeles waltl]